MTDIHVQDIIDKAYEKSSYIENKSAFENQCYEDAIQRLEPEDREYIEGVVKMFYHRKPSSKKKTVRLHNFGKASALELMAMTVEDALDYLDNVCVCHGCECWEDHDWGGCYRTQTTGKMACDLRDEAVDVLRKIVFRKMEQEDIPIEYFESGGK